MESFNDCISGWSKQPQLIATVILFGIVIYQKKKLNDLDQCEALNLQAKKHGGNMSSEAYN